MRVVPDETDTHAQAVMKRLSKVGEAVVVGVAEQPEIRNVRIPDRAVAREDAGANAVERRAETVGENRGVIRLAVTIAVFDPADPFAVLRIAGKAVAQMPLGTLTHGALARQTRRAAAERGHADLSRAARRAVQTKGPRLRREAARKAVRTKDGIGEHWFGGPEIDFEAGGDLEFLDGQFTFLRSGGHDRGFGDVGGFILRPNRGASQREQ